ncbi:MAG: SpoIIE family protein phosphatase [Ilumatobacteraceae bacterium]
MDHAEPCDTDEISRLASVLATGLTNTADETMDRLAGLVTRLLGASIGLVSLVDDHRQFFPGQVGLPDPLSDDRQTPLDQSMCRTVVARGEMLQINHASTDPNWNMHGAFTVLGVESYLGAPLLDSDGRVLGSLCAIEPTERVWTAEERQILLDLAFSASSELRARIAATEANQARARVEMMADASAALISTMDPREAIERMLDVIIERFGMWAFVYLSADEGRPESIHARHRHPDRSEFVSEFVANASVGLRDMPVTRSVLSGSVPSVVLDAEQAAAAGANSGASARLFESLGLGPLVIVPMAVAGKITGVLAVFAEPARLAFDPIDVALVGDVGRRAAMTLDHAYQFNREKRVASELQQGLLPVLPVVDRLQTDAVYAAAAHGIEVGGDWYDLIEVGDGSYMAVIGDVTGHSIRAAAAMGRVQTAVHIFAGAGYEPDQILDRIAAATPRLLADLLATCLIIHLRQRPDGDWDLAAANAGHLPPVIVTANGTARLFEVYHDVLLGMHPNSSPLHRTAHGTIATGSTLLLYTDGLVERRREPLDDSLERLLVAAADKAKEPFHGWCSRLMTELDPDHRDDIACIAIRF